MTIMNMTGGTTGGIEGYQVPVSELNRKGIVSFDPSMNMGVFAEGSAYGDSELIAFNNAIRDHGDTINVTPSGSGEAVDIIRTDTGWRMLCQRSMNTISSTGALTQDWQNSTPIVAGCFVDMNTVLFIRGRVIYKQTWNGDTWTDAGNVATGVSANDYFIAHSGDRNTIVGCNLDTRYSNGYILIDPIEMTAEWHGFGQDVFIRGVTCFDDRVCMITDNGVVMTFMGNTSTQVTFPGVSMTSDYLAYSNGEWLIYDDTETNKGVIKTLNQSFTLTFPTLGATTTFDNSICGLYRNRFYGLFASELDSIGMYLEAAEPPGIAYSDGDIVVLPSTD